MGAAKMIASSPSKSEDLAKVASFIEAYEANTGASLQRTFYLTGADEHDRVELTEELYTLLKQTVTALADGKSVSILAQDQEITTQQAAEILGVSRPTIVKLINDGELPAHIPGTARRKLFLADVLTYRARLHERRSDFISTTGASYDEQDEAIATQLLGDLPDDL